MGDAKDKRYMDSRLLRVVKLDFAQPLDAKVTAEFLLDPGSAAAAPGKPKPDAANVADADWVGPDELAILARGKTAVRLVLADFSQATNILPDPRAAGLAFEDIAADLAAMGVKPARTTDIFSTAQAPQINSLKLEGLAMTGPNEIALVNDNDFGIGDNKNGEPSKVRLVKLDRPVMGN
jgi:hypothetical protein